MCIDIYTEREREIIYRYYTYIYIYAYAYVYIYIYICREGEMSIRVEAKAEEENSQEGYEKLMSDSAEKRTKDSKLDQTRNLTKRKQDI